MSEVAKMSRTDQKLCQVGLTRESSLYEFLENYFHVFTLQAPVLFVLEPYFNMSGRCEYS